MSALKKGFTLIELLVVISIIGVLIGLSVFGLQGARQVSRDSKRRIDLESIKSGIEIYKSDCNSYPVSAGGDPSTVLATNGTSLKGSGTPTSCATTNTYIAQIPKDPIDPNKNYRYASNGVTYEICASLEQGASVPAVTCGGSSSCGSGNTCNYKVVNP
ncbi:MAG: prepilin-type N-terminal cleavage/methylation domain-containing protein [bacterium]|nr:prepilin-type N-terminal cleavage/methylation domain-containing protein [bacterium]